jgi:hypothetical protein
MALIQCSFGTPIPSELYMSLELEATPRARRVKARDLAVAEQGYTVGEVEVDVLVDGGQVAVLAGVRVALVQEHDGYGAVIRTPEHERRWRGVAQQ